MREIGRVAAACVVTIVALACPSHASQDIPEIRAAARAAAAKDWARLRIDRGVTVRFPVRYEDEMMTHNGVKTHIYRASRENAYYSVDVQYYGAPPAEGGDALLDDWFEFYPESVGGELVFARRISLAGYPGREFEAVFKGGLLRGRVYVAGNRVFALVVSYGVDVSGREAAEIDRFLTSLEIDAGKIPRSAGGRRNRAARGVVSAPGRSR